MTHVAGGLPEDTVRNRTWKSTSIMWHVITFVIVNALLFGVDIAGGGGVQWAHWVTILWGLGLVLHLVSFFAGPENVNNRLDQRYSEEKRRYDETGTGPSSRFSP